MNLTSRPVPNRNQGISNQRGDAGRVEELNTQVRINHRNGFVIFYSKVSQIYIYSHRGRIVLTLLGINGLTTSYGNTSSIVSTKYIYAQLNKMTRSSWKN
jgi:hypothetical protein